MILYERATTIDEQVYGPSHPEVATGLNKLAGMLAKQVRASHVLLDRPIRVQHVLSCSGSRRCSRPHCPPSVTPQGKYGKAEELYEKSLAIREGMLGSDHPHVAALITNWAELLATQVRVYAPSRECLVTSKILEGTVGGGLLASGAVSLCAVCVQLTQQPDRGV